MKYLFLALILAAAGDVAFNRHRYVDDVLGGITALAHGSADAASHSIFAS